MPAEPIVVLGGGNTAFSVAAKLSLEGHQVVLWEAPEQAASIVPIRDTRQIRLSGTGGEGTATLAGVTTDAAQALAAGDVLLAPVPSYAHAPFATHVLPHLRREHILALLPGNLGSLFFARLLRETSFSPA